MKTKIFIIGLITACIFYSCTKGFLGENVNPAQPAPTVVDPSNMLAYLEKYGSFGNANLEENMQNYYSDMFAQFFMDTYEHTNNYIMYDALAQEPYWTALYQWLAMDKQIIATTDTTKKDCIQMARIWKVFMFDRATDLFGDIPYSQAGLVTGPAPAYDTQQSIYMSFLAELKDASTKLDPNFVYPLLASNDIIYGGNITLWRKFANSLLLRIAMRISLVDPADAQTYAEWAVNSANGGVLEQGDQYPGVPSSNTQWGNWYPLFFYVEYGDLAMTQSMYNILCGLGGQLDSAYFGEIGDPRGNYYFTTVTTTSMADTTALYFKKFRAMPSGLTSAQYASEQSVMTDFSRPNVETYPSSRAFNLFATNESYFLRAEGAARGWNMGGSAQYFYEAGITCSMADYNIPATVVSAYIASSAPNNNKVSVAFNAGGTLDQQLDQIITQKYIGLYPDNSFEAWADMRRLLKPYIIPVQDCQPITTGITQFTGGTPTEANYIQRIEYPVSESLVDTGQYNKVKARDLETIVPWWGLGTNKK